MSSGHNHVEQNISWSEMQNNQMNISAIRDNRYSSVFNESPDRRTLLSQKRHAYEPLVDINAVSMSGRDVGL